MRKKSPVILLFLCLTMLFSTVAQATTLDDTTRQEALALASENVPQLTDEEKDALLSALYEADLADIREALELRLITCQDLTAYYLERIEAYNEEYNCFITMCDNAMEVAAQRDAEIQAGTAEGALFGIPIVVKDNIHVSGYPTTNGYTRDSVEISTVNAIAVDRLLEEGAVIIAKSNMSTEAQDARASYSNAVGHTKNAYSTYMTPGGSSGGSAVAASLNFCAASIGTDTNSSLRLPASLNGCIALRVTKGLIPMDNIIKLNGTRDVVGSITRSVEDQAIMLDALTGGTYYENLNANVLTGMRIGILDELSYLESQDTDIDQEVIDAFNKAVEELRSCGAEVITVSMSNLRELSQTTFTANNNAAIASMTVEFEAFLRENNISAVIFPTLPTTPLRIGTDANGTYWDPFEQPFYNNCRVLSPCAAVPEITVPIGIHSLGAGIGMEIAAAQNSEQLLLDIAYAYTMQYNHRSVPTGAPDLYAASTAGTLADRIDAYLLSLLPVEEEEPEEPVEEPIVEPEPEPEPEEEDEKLELSILNIIVISCTALVLITAFIRGIISICRKVKARKAAKKAAKEAKETVTK